jgi:hypothetical protein
LTGLHERCCTSKKQFQEVTICQNWFTTSCHVKCLKLCLLYIGRSGRGFSRSSLRGLAVRRACSHGYSLRTAKGNSRHLSRGVCRRVFCRYCVESTIILELKSVKALNEVMEAQVINYLKLSGLPVGYLINFNGPRVEWRRYVNLRDG